VVVVSSIAAGVLLTAGLVVCLLCIGAGWRAARPRLVEPDRTPDDDDLLAVRTSTQDGGS
jgi:hypothetical protein